MSAVIIGGGISGLAAATVLAEHMPVTVLDRGHRVGGRMGTTVLRSGPWRGHTTDLGAAYFTARDERFQVVVADWLDRGLARAWTNTLLVAREGRIVGESSGVTRYAATNGLRALPEDITDHLPGNVTTVTSTVATRLQLIPSGFAIEAQGRDTGSTHRYSADVVLLCLPGPQAISLLAQSEATRMPHCLTAARAQIYEPIITVVGQWDQRRWQRFHGCFVNDDPRLSFVADDGDRRGDGAAVLVAHSSHELARQHLGDPHAVEREVIGAVRELLDIDTEPLDVLTRRWSLARPLPQKNAVSTCAYDEVGLGLAGDAFSENPRIEAAWISGTELATRALATAGAK